MCAQGADAENWITRTDSLATGNMFSFGSHDSGGMEQTQEATCKTCGRAVGHHYKSCPQICWGLPCLRKIVLVRSRRRNFTCVPPEAEFLGADGCPLQAGALVPGDKLIPQQGAVVSVQAVGRDATAALGV